MSDSIPLSKRKVICASCDQECSSRYNLKIHFATQHPKEVYREKGQSLLSFSKAVDKHFHDARNLPNSLA